MEFMKEREYILNKCKSTPFSNIWMARVLSDKIPEGSVLHLGILNSLRAWNFFETPRTVTCFSNTGGFGIDGCLSSMIGAAIASPRKRFFLVLGDLAFFYDCNVLLNKIPSNVHILVINNGLGIEFKNYNHRAAIFGSETNKFIAASNHNGFKSPYVISSFAKNNGIEYLSANNKEEFLKCHKRWIESEKAIILEAFTNEKDESDALKIMNSTCNDLIASFGLLAKRIAKRILKR